MILRLLDTKSNRVTYTYIIRLPGCVCTRVTGRRQCHILTLFYPRTMLFCVRAMTLTPISTPKIGLIQEIQSVQQYYSSITFKGEQTRTLLF